MTVNGEETFDKGLEFKFGLMEPNMKVNGLTIRLKEKENSHMLMVIFMMEIGKRTRHQVMEFIFITMVHDMKVNG